MQRRVLVRMRATNSSTYEQYAQILAGDAAEVQALTQEFAIHVTHFFRDSSIWTMLAQNIIPILANSRDCRIWSAGCSSGEEAVTLAILMEEYGEKIGKELQYTIVGTDIDPEILIDARNAQYTEEQFKEMPATYKLKYFTPLNGKFKAKEQLTSHMIFREKDLLTATALEKYDLIMCRNTIIYFAPESKAQLIARFYDALKPDGYLLLGKTETLQNENRHLFDVENLAERLYKRAK